MPTLRYLMAAGVSVAIVLNSLEAEASEKTPPRIAVSPLASQNEALPLDVTPAKITSKASAEPSESSEPAIAQTPTPTEEETLPTLEFDRPIPTETPTETVAQTLPETEITESGETEAVEVTEDTPIEAAEESTATEPELETTQTELAPTVENTEAAEEATAMEESDIESAAITEETPTDASEAVTESTEPEPEPESAAITEETPTDAASEATTESAETEPVDIVDEPQASPEALIEAQQSGLTPLTEEEADTAQTITVPPAFLNPSPNPLLFPTRPSEVEIVTTEAISLEEALELARQNNLELERSVLELERSHENLREAKADLFPDVDLQLGFVRTDSAATELSLEQRFAIQNLTPEQEEAQRDLSPTVSNDFTGQIGITYNIFTSGLRGAQIATAELQVRQDELEVERISEDIRLDVATAYYDLQEADGNVRINEAAVGNAEKSLEDAEALERAGVGTQFDVLRAEVNLANAEQDLTGSLSDQRIAQRQLAQVLNIDQQANIVAADPVEVAGLWELSLEQTIVAAIKNRAELEQQLLQREISEQQRRAALSQIGPQVSLSANYNVINDLDDDVGFADGTSVQVQATWRLFDGGAARAAARQQEINAEIAENQFAEQRNQIRFSVEQFYSDLEANLESIQTANKALEQAQEALELARLRFQAGVGTQTEVIDSETDLTRAEDNLLDAIISYNRSLVGLQRTVSNLPLTDYVLE